MTIDFVESGIYDTELNISTAEPSWVYSSVGNVQIVEGTTITNESGTWSHEVNVNDKRIKLSNGNQEIELDVIERTDRHNPPTFYPAADDAHTTIANLSFINHEVNPSVIFSDDYSYLALPFQRYHISIKSRVNVVNNVTENEYAAIESLREMITPTIRYPRRR